MNTQIDVRTDAPLWSSRTTFKYDYKTILYASQLQKLTVTILEAMDDHNEWNSKLSFALKHSLDSSLIYFTQQIFGFEDKSNEQKKHMIFLDQTMWNDFPI